jgi:hypothetical protein
MPALPTYLIEPIWEQFSALLPEPSSTSSPQYGKGGDATGPPISNSARGLPRKKRHREHHLPKKFACPGAS